MVVLPIVMIKNEEIWIERVLTSLSRVFNNVIVADTGSTDTTIEQVMKVKNITLIKYNDASPEQVGLIRGDMQMVAKGMGASHVMLVDGDELYPTKYLKYIYNNPMPETSPCGFTDGVECGELSTGELIQYSAHKSRDAIFSIDSKWKGIYPFEGHSAFNQNMALNHYWPSLEPAHHFFHLHGCRRSTKDKEVHVRLQKKHQFNMREESSALSYTIWLNSEKDYKDEHR